MVEMAEAVDAAKPDVVLSKELAQRLVDAASAYYRIILEDTAEVERGDLGDRARSEADRHLEELGVLQEYLEDYSDNPANFEIRYQKVDRDAGVFSAKLSRKGDPPFGIGQENSQTQLNFYSQRAQGAESYDQSTRFESIGNDPHTAMEIRDDLHRGRVTVNTVQIYNDTESSKIKLLPQAGIQVRSGRDGITQQGVKYVGTQPHFAEIPMRSGFTSSDVRSLQEVTSGLATERRQFPR